VKVKGEGKKRKTADARAREACPFFASQCNIFDSGWQAYFKGKDGKLYFQRFYFGTSTYSSTFANKAINKTALIKEPREFRFRAPQRRKAATQVNINLLFISRTKDKRQRNEGYNSIHFSPYTIQSDRRHRTRPCEAAPTRDTFPTIARKTLTTKHKKPRCQTATGRKTGRTAAKVAYCSL